MKSFLLLLLTFGCTRSHKLELLNKARFVDCFMDGLNAEAISNTENLVDIRDEEDRNILSIILDIAMNIEKKESYLI